MSKTGTDLITAERGRQICAEGWTPEHDAQLGMVAEECGELVVAVSHYRRKREGAVESMIEEGADVLITIMQLRLLAPDRFDAAVAAKLRRLECRLEALHA